VNQLASENIQAIAANLKNRYADFLHYNKRNPLHNLIFVLCSVRTDEDKYIPAFRSLRRKFPRVEMLAKASTKSIAQTLKNSGRQNQKAAAIKRIVQETIKHFGKPSLSELSRMSDVECEAFLTSLPWVGKKVARCVMMYPLGRKVFPVDTHVWRICRRLGLVEPTRADSVCSPKDMDKLQDKIPADLRLSLHVNMVSLGREFCAPQRPLCPLCPIEEYCQRVGSSVIGRASRETVVRNVSLDNQYN